MAAVSTATVASTAYYTATQNHVSSKNNRVSISRLYFDVTKQRRKLLLVTRNSSDESATTATESEPPVEVSKDTSSLISSLNVEKALRGLVAAITDADHYGRLGLPTGCSYEQVNVAYKNKVTELMNKGLGEEQLSKELELLKESHSILSSVEERRLYDWSLARSGKPDRYMWPFELDITQTPLTVLHHLRSQRMKGQQDWWDTLF
ncbi:hypothetical protein DH2020_025418 [Rehmannia glutinosa]|uniref:Uncharacterized protein n=1 Tax=Rehmannia glutinosa TaxID=99300 RepID=A0ABR0VZS7_REHGL